MERLYQANGVEGIRRLRDNLSKVSLVSLFSGLGGAELLMQNIFAGVRAVADDLGLERPLQPRNLPLIFHCVSILCNGQFVKTKHDRFR